MSNATSSNTQSVIYNTHANDAPGFAFNGAARSVAFGGPARVESRVPVKTVPGRRPPFLEGESGGYFTLSGDVVHHPSAYAKRGWSNMVHRPDTRVVVVGSGWTPDSWRTRRPNVTN